MGVMRNATPAEMRWCGFFDAMDVLAAGNGVDMRSFSSDVVSGGAVKEDGRH